MAKMKPYLDKRSPNKDGKYPVTIYLLHEGQNRLLPTGVYVREEHWHPGDKDTDPHIKKTFAGYKGLNSIIESIYEAHSNNLTSLVKSGDINLYHTATSLKKHLMREIDSRSQMSFTEYFDKYLAEEKNEGTKRNRYETFVKVHKFSKKGTFLIDGWGSATDKEHILDDKVINSGQINPLKTYRRGLELLDSHLHKRFSIKESFYSEW